MRTKSSYQTKMSSYNLRPRKQTDYRVLNGYKPKANTPHIVEECPPQPAVEPNLPSNEQKNMNTSFTEKFDNAVLQLNLLLSQITDEKNRDKKITFILHFFQILYHFIIEYRHINAHTLSTCKTLTETYLMKYREFNPEIIQYCIENKKYKELETFHIHSSNLAHFISSTV